MHLAVEVAALRFGGNSRKYRSGRLRAPNLD
jgi:hypothetical protein